MIKIIGLVMGLIILSFGVINYLNSRPLTKEDFEKNLSRKLERIIRNEGSVEQGLIYIKAPHKAYEGVFTVGKLDGQKIDETMPFHVASVGKTVTATMIAMLVEEGLVTYGTPVSKILNATYIDQLFLVEGKDYREEVTIWHLLTHTSGVADYFGDPVTVGKTLIEEALEAPDRLYDPMTLLEFSKKRQKSVAIPGRAYHYSDTGYILLGLIIEEVTGKSFETNLHERILIPLEMKDTYMMFRSEPTNGLRPIGHIYLHGQEVSKTMVPSIDWAGGGLISTLKDLDTFIRALYQGELIKVESLATLQQYNEKFMYGMDYGAGLMVFNLDRFVPFVKGLSRPEGHMGILGTQMVYDPLTGTTYIASFGSDEFGAGSVRLMVQVFLMLHQLKAD